MSEDLPDLPALDLTQQDLADGFLDAIAMVETYKAEDRDGFGAVLAAQLGRNGLGLVIGLLQLLVRALAEGGEDVTEWAARQRAHRPY